MTTRAATVPGATPAAPPLKPGDCLAREEFERRYAAMPDVKKAELIEGKVHMASAVRWRHHGRPHFVLTGWLAAYEAETPGVQGGDNSSIRMDLDNEPQPDATLIIDPARGGRVRFSDDDYIEGAPELVIEVAASSASIDLTTKLRVYQQNAVGEYLVWRVPDRAVDSFVLRKGEYVPFTPTDGVLRSESFPGLWLDVEAMIKLDLAAVLRTLHHGLASPEHAAFVGRLGTERRP